MADGSDSAPITAGPTPDGIMARPATPPDLDHVARIFVAAFPREFRLLFGNRQRVAEEVVWHVLHCDYPGGQGVWVAHDGGNVIGMMLLDSPPQFRPRLPWRLAWHIVWRHVGLRGLLRLARALLMPHYAVRAGEVYVRAIGVAAGHRGHGAGTCLLHCAEEWGRRHHKGWLGLHVKSENPRAHTLYQRMGYVERGYRSSLVTWACLRQRGSYYMTKPLREAGG